MKDPRPRGRPWALCGITLACALLALWAGPSAAAAAPRPAPAAGSTAAVLGARAVADALTLQGRTYVALGDSISEGKYATTADRIFPALVARELGMHLELDAKSGAKAAWALPQLAAIQGTQPALVTIELGTNDVGFKTPLLTFGQQYDAIVTAVAGPATRVLCIGSWLPSDAVDGIIESTCEHHGGTFVSLSGFYAAYDFHAPSSAPVFLGQSDWFHPGDQGHAAIAATVLASLPGYRGGDSISPSAAAASTLRAPS